MNKLIIPMALFAMISLTTVSCQKENPTNSITKK